jgi:hypothetical protein
MLVAMEARHLAHPQLLCELGEERVFSLVRLEWWTATSKEATRSECIFSIWIGQGQKEGPVQFDKEWGANTGTLQ